MLNRKIFYIFILVILKHQIACAQSVETYISRAQEYHIHSQTDSAVYFYKKAVLSHFHEDRKIESLNLAVDIADVFYSNSDFENGLKILDVLIQQPLFYQNEGERTALLETYLFTAYGLEQSGKFIQAKNVYETARLNLVNKAEYEDFYVGRYLYEPLGNIYTRLGELEEALKLLQRFKEISIAEKKYNAAAQAYNDIGIIYKSRNHYDKVIADYQAALKFPELDHITKGLLLSNLATAFYETLQNEKALQAAELSITEFRRALVNNSNSKEVLSYLSQLHSTIGRIYTLLNQPKLSIKNFEQSIELAIRAYGTQKRREVAKIYINIGYLYLLQNDADQALEYYQRALSSVLPGFEPTDIYQNPDSDSLYPENAIFEALEGKTRALELLYEGRKDTDLLKATLQCFDLIANVEWQLRQDYLNESSKLFLIEESHLRSERALNVAYQLYQVTNDPVYIEKAFQIAERSKATILLESLKTLKVNDFANIPDSLLLKEQELKSGVALLKKNILYEQLKGPEMDSVKVQSLSNDLFTDEIALQQLNATFLQEYPEYFHLRKTASKNINLDTLREEMLSPHSQLVAYFTGQNSLFIFSLTQNEFEIVKTGKGESFDETVRSLLRLITKRKLHASDPVVFAEVSGELFDKLLTPVIKENKEKLIIIPDGILGYLPFDLLVDQKQEQPKFSTLHYLVKSKTISYGFSAGILLENMIPNHTTNYKESFLGIAPGFKNSPTFAFLPFSEEEVISIREEFGGRALLHEDATKANFKSMAGQYGILHLSSHASVVDSLPMYSWISFSDASGGDENDYKLYLSELYSMRLNANMAVLSACETGSGKLSRGEGIMSLARGFAYSGCNSIITTLWPVNDASTSFIMTRFYHHLAENKPKDEALRLAKLDYLNGDNIDQFGANPFFWAAYIPIGNMEPIETGEQNKAYLWLVVFVIGLIATGFIIKFRNLEHKYDQDGTGQ